MEKEFQIHVFGKAGCDKCSLLNKRIDQFLQEDAWRAFEKVYFDVDTVDGLVAFAQAECLNPARIPGLVIAHRDADTGRFRYLHRLAHIDQTDKSLLIPFHGVQTDYSQAGKGIISPATLKKLLEQASELSTQQI